MMACNADKFTRAFRRHGLEQLTEFADDDAALEHCENLLLQEIAGPGWAEVTSVELADCFLLSDLSADELTWLDERMSKGEAAKGNYLIRAGDAGDSLFLILSGSVEVRLSSESGQNGKRIDVFEAGMSFGEMGFLDGSPRSADVVALDHVDFRVISRQLFDLLDKDHPGLKIKLLEHLARLLSSNLRKSNTEVSAYKG
jgi:glutaminase